MKHQSKLESIDLNIETSLVKHQIIGFNHQNHHFQGKNNNSDREENNTIDLKPSKIYDIQKDENNEVKSIVKPKIKGKNHMEVISTEIYKNPVMIYGKHSFSSLKELEKITDSKLLNANCESKESGEDLSQQNNVIDTSKESGRSQIEESNTKFNVKRRGVLEKSPENDYGILSSKAAPLRLKYSQQRKREAQMGTNINKNKISKFTSPKTLWTTNPKIEEIGEPVLERKQISESEVKQNKKTYSIAIDSNESSLTMRTLKQKDKGSLKMTLNKRDPILAKKTVMNK